MNNEIYMTNEKKKAADYRRIAREKLKRFYWTVFAVILLAGLLGGITTAGSGTSFSFNLPATDDADGGTGTDVIYDGKTAQEILEDLQGMTSEERKEFFAQVIEELSPELSVFFAVLMGAFAVGILFGIGLTLFVGSPVALGLQRFLLNVMDEENVKLDVLFAYFKKGYGKSVVFRILHSLILFAASIPYTVALIGGAICIVLGLLFMGQPALILMGILLFLCAIPLSLLTAVFQYRYFFAATVLAEYPNTSPVDAIRISRQIMKGNKWRLFCLRLSFIGWQLLSICTCGIGLLFLNPYMYTAEIAFYDDITNRRAAKETTFPSIDPDDYLPTGENEAI